MEGWSNGLMGLGDGDWDIGWYCRWGKLAFEMLCGVWCMKRWWLCRVFCDRGNLLVVENGVVEYISSETVIIEKNIVLLLTMKKILLLLLDTNIVLGIINHR